MHHAFRYLSLFLLLTVGALSVSAPAMASDSREEILVGRIAHTEGKLLRYIEEENDWVVTVRDAPFGLEDALYAGNDAKAEFIMPNRTWLRIGENTQIQLIDLNPDATTVDVAAGLARLYNKSRDAVMKVTTPFGYVVAPGGTIVDLYVGDESLEVIPIRGNVDFVHDGTRARYKIREGSSSIIADRRSTSRGNGTVDSQWDDWNGRRDTVWAQRLQDGRNSAEYLPEPIRDESYALAENGRWERVYYEGAYRDMWRPTRVDPGWRPYTAGRWSVYYGDNCWIPDEPFGYVTHHYGSWVYVETFRSWYWTPPVARTVSRVPGISISFGWYPGRVGWIHSGPSIGWVPLAPDEIYYGYRPWGHRTVIVRQSMVPNINLTRYRYLDEAVIIHRDHLYRGKRYTPHVQRNVGRAALINNYRPAPVINTTIINNYDTDKRRFALSDAKVTRKPHTTVVNRINDNQQMIRNVGRINRERIERDLTRVNVAAQPPVERNVRAPMLTPKLMDADQIAQPIDTVSLPQKEIKPKDRERRLVSDNDQRRGSRDQGQTRQIRTPANQDDSRRMRSASDARNQVMEQTGVQNPPQKTDPEQIETRRPRQPDQAKDGIIRDENQRSRSPREIQPQGAEHNVDATSPRPDDARRPPRDRRDLDQNRDKSSRDENQRIRSPEDARNQQAEQEAILQQDRVRRIEESQRRQVLELQRQQEEGQRQQEQEVQRRQQELRQRQQEEGQRRQQQEVQRRQQEEGQRRQQQEVQQRQQEEGLRQQQQEVRQRQQEEGQRRQQQEVQQRQQEEGQRRQQQEVQRRQQGEGQRQQEQELRQRQQEGQRRQQQEEIQRQRQQPQNKKKETLQEEALLPGQLPPNQ